MNWYLEVLKKYAVFTGRARRTEYWMFFLFNTIIFVALYAVESLIGGPGILAMLYKLAIIVPLLAVSVRRLHDTDRSGWWVLLGLIPVVGALVLLVFFVMDSQPGSNQYGPNPKEVAPAG